MSRRALLHVFPVVAGILILPTLLCAQKVASHVRVVRLSYVSGTVGVKRPASTEWAKAQANTPIQEGFEISTAANSYAEVEFENGSTARLGELSRLNFSQLALDEDGDKLNALTFEQGYATFHILPEHHDSYTVKIASASLSPSGKSEFRADLDQGKVRVEVFMGSVEVATAAKTIKLGKDKTVEFNSDSPEMAMNVKQGIVKDSWDKWTFGRDTQAQLSLNDQAVSSPGSLYGWSDLDAYGEWGYFPGFGYGWSPFASAGWSPYNMGMWSFYPGMGYTWISGEPWGWLPYHYGTWNLSPGFGWFWTPGSFSTFSPALVSWYSGSGWVGWSPLGAVGSNIVTTAPGRVVQNGVAITPQTVSHAPVAAGARVKSLSFEPGAGAMLSGPMLSANSESLFTARAGATHIMAPDSILMGGNAEREGVLEGGRQSHQPLRVREGNTLGGAYAVRGGLGEFRGDAFAGMHGSHEAEGLEFGHNAAMGGPTLLPHGQQVSGSPSHNGQPPAAPNWGNNPGPSSMGPGPSAPSGGHSASSSPGHH